MSSETHVTGESLFVDDIPAMRGELFVGYVGSPVACGELLSIDSRAALKIPGVVAVFTAKDVHKNLWGTIVLDQPLMVDRAIGYQDEPVCIVAAETRQALELGRKAVRLKIKPLPAVLTLAEAMRKKSYLVAPTPFRCGDVDAAFAQAPHRLSGKIDIGGQEHFYLESQASLVYPVDGCGLKVISSTQHPTETQHVVAHAVGLPYHQVACEVPRMGGAFGGKESQAAPFAAMAAMVAHRLQRPARIVLSKDDDMKVTGKRHPFHADYDVAFDNNGKILGWKVKLYADGGAYTDLSPSILDRAMFHADGSYFLENALVEGWVCKTNMHSHTAFRGFGGPQGNLVIESAIEEIAAVLKIDAARIRRLNLYGKTERNRTHYGQVVEANLLPELFSRALQVSRYEQRRAEITTFNRRSTTTLRGLAVSGVKFGISFTTRFLNQGSALVHVHRDGTVQVATGATEMGQGVNAKIQAVVSRQFGLPAGDVKVTITSTEKNANTSPTAASSGSDINGAAAQLACEKILNRLRQVACYCFALEASGRKPPVVEEFEETPELKAKSAAVVFAGGIVRLGDQSMPWQSLISKAYLNRVSLSDFAHYKTPDLAFDRASGQGKAFKYFTPGAAVSEVSVDVWTGEVKILSSHIVMDLGRPIVHGVDHGQVTGGFVQGAGWLTSEKLFYDPSGRLVSHSPTTYKIPNIQDMPREFSVEFLENDLNEGAVLKSKAVGEPPLLLGASVFLAIKNALSYRSKEKTVRLNAPATPETVLMELSRYEL